MKPRLLFVVNLDVFFVSHRLPIALEALKSGYEVHLAAGVTTTRGELERLGLTVHSLSIDRKSAGLVSNTKTFFQLTRLFRQLRPDIVHLVTIKPVLLGGIAARVAGVASLVASISGLGFIFIAKGFKARIRLGVISLFYKMALRHRRLKVIFQNENDRAVLFEIAGLRSKDTSLIRGSGVDLDAYQATSIPKGVPVVMMASRLLVDKGVREFVEAARIVKHDSESIRFVLVGAPDPGNPRSISENELNRWEEEGAVEWWGHRDDIPAVIASSHVFVLPSYYGEGLPKVLIEAAACKRAIVTTDHPGCRDAIEPGKSGLLVPPHDVGALADAIMRLIHSPLLCEEMGQAGRELAERVFDVNFVVKQHLGIYEELMQRTG